MQQENLIFRIQNFTSLYLRIEANYNEKNKSLSMFQMLVVIKCYKILDRMLHHVKLFAENALTGTKNAHKQFYLSVCIFLKPFT